MFCIPIFNTYFKRVRHFFSFAKKSTNINRLKWYFYDSKFLYNNLVVKLYLFQSTFRVCNAANLILILFAIIYNIHLQTREDNFFCSTHNFFFIFSCMHYITRMNEEQLDDQAVPVLRNPYHDSKRLFVLYTLVDHVTPHISQCYLCSPLFSSTLPMMFNIFFAWYFHRKSGEFL